jgi:TatD DNase family protein
VIETHAHMNFPEFDEDRDAALGRARDAGVHTIINIATDFESCDRVIELAESHERLFAVVGVHPHDAKSWDGNRSAERLRKLAKHPKVVAIGEIGLDYYRDYSPRDRQKAAFVDQIAVAREMKLPIVIHNRDAFDDVFDALLDTEAFEVGGVFHCFSESPERAQQTIDLGFYISVNGVLTYKNSTMAAVGQSARLDRILLETDCPFLAPHPFRGKRNEPSYIPHIANHLAELRGCTFDDVNRITDANACEVFKLPPQNVSQGA